MVSNKKQLKYVLTAIAAINAKAKEGALQPAVNANTNGNGVGKVGGFRRLEEDSEENLIENPKENARTLGKKFIKDLNKFSYGDLEPNTSSYNAAGGKALAAGEEALDALEHYHEVCSYPKINSEWKTLQRLIGQVKTLLKKSHGYNRN